MPRAEKRKQRRMPYNASLHYSISISKPDGTKTVTITETVKAVDISKKGLGIVTSFPIKLDHLITIKSLNGTHIPEKAVVRWRAKKGLWYRVGLMFV